jgi:hypothetical protein
MEGKIQKVSKNLGSHHLSLPDFCYLSLLFWTLKCTEMDYSYHFNWRIEKYNQNKNQTFISFILFIKHFNSEIKLTK